MEKIIIKIATHTPLNRAIHFSVLEDFISAMEMCGVTAILRAGIITLYCNAITANHYFKKMVILKIVDKFSSCVAHSESTLNNDKWFEIDEILFQEMQTTTVAKEYGISMLMGDDVMCRRCHQKILKVGGLECSSKECSCNVDLHNECITPLDLIFNKWCTRCKLPVNMKIQAKNLTFMTANHTRVEEKYLFFNASELSMIDGATKHTAPIKCGKSYHFRYEYIVSFDLKIKITHIHLFVDVF